MYMKKKDTLLNKVILLLKRINAPTYLNKYGPKKYTLAKKVYALFLRSEWKCSFRRTVRLCKDIDLPCPSKSTLHYILNKLPWKWIKNMLMISIKKQAGLALIDGSTLSRNRVSDHYIMRAGIKNRERRPTKISIMVDSRTKKILSARVRKKFAHDIKDVKYLIKNAKNKPRKIVADRGYDAEWFRRFLVKQGIRYCIPTRNYKHKRGRLTKANKCDLRTYRRRTIVESSFFRLKQLFGQNICCNTARNIRAEVFIRMILYNISSRFITT